MGKTYDILIVGAGLYGSVVARRATDRGMRCLVLEKRDTVGGNILDKDIDGINVHLHGAHIFHTDSERVWNFVNRYVSFNNYVHAVLARDTGRMYHLPINLTTFHEVYGISRPSEIEHILTSERAKENYPNPHNLEEKAVSMVGRRMYDLLIKGYTEKQWGRNPSTLPQSTINRLPIRTTFDNRYFSDRYQGIPIFGYRLLIHKLLDGIEVNTGIDFNENRDFWTNKANRIVYTGMADELADYCYGELEYRSLDFVIERKEQNDWQGTAVINETSSNVPYTRTIEHKHFDKQCTTQHTIITFEYPMKWKRGQEAYYPINDDTNNCRYQNYADLIRKRYPTLTLGGRLGKYKYYDMDDAIEAALDVKL